MICTLKMLLFSLINGYDTFWTWGILLVPLFLVLAVLLVIGFGGLETYRSVGQTHARGGWALIVLSVLAYVGVALFGSESLRGPYKVYVLNNLHDRTPGVENRRMAMLTDNNAALEKMAEQIPQEWGEGLLANLQERIAEDGDDGEALAYKTSFVNYIGTLGNLSQSVIDLVQQGRYADAFSQLHLNDAAQSFFVNLLEGDLNTTFKRTFRDWFRSLDNTEGGAELRQTLEKERFASPIPDERDAREIAYRSGYTQNVSTIKFFVGARAWFRGVLWALAGIAIGAVFVARGKTIVRNSGKFKQMYQI